MFIKKEASNGTLSTEEVIKIFENTNDMDEIKAAVEKAEDRIYASWASVDMKDKAGELIPINDLIKQQDTLLKRHGPISDTHTNKIVGETLAYKVLEHPKSKSTGVLHLNKIFSDNLADDQVWKETQSGERKGSSVGGLNTGTSLGKDEVTGENVTVLNGFSQYETANVHDPCNPLALNEAVSVVAKSNVSKVKILLKPGEDPPKGFTAQTGPRGGRFYESGGDKKPSKPKKPSTDGNDSSDESDGGGRRGRGNGGKRGGGHDHDEEDPKGLHTHPELEKGDKTYDDDETNINKLFLKVKQYTKQGDLMTDDVTKELKNISELVKTNALAIAKLIEKQDAPEEEEKPAEEEEKTEDEDEKKTAKAEDEEEPKEEDRDKKKVSKEEDEKKPKDEEEVDKENAASDIEGLTDAPNEPGPDPEESNQIDAFKKLEKKMNDKFSQMRKAITASTPFPGAFKDTKKAEEFYSLPMDYAMGVKKTNWQTAHREFNKHCDNKEKVI